MNRADRRKLAKSVNPDGSVKVKPKRLTRAQAHARIKDLEAQIQRITDRLPNYEKEQPARAARAKAFRSDLESDVAALRKRFPR